MRFHAMNEYSIWKVESLKDVITHLSFCVFKSANASDDIDTGLQHLFTQRQNSRIWLKVPPLAKRNSQSGIRSNKVRVTS